MLPRKRTAALPLRDRQTCGQWANIFADVWTTDVAHRHCSRTWRRHRVRASVAAGVCRLLSLHGARPSRRAWRLSSC